ncbi:MAG: DUF4386 family protein [Chloroflexota bacterium]|nr:DUF4386 family protein [Chloroflexota bacterium]
MATVVDRPAPPTGHRARIRSPKREPALLRIGAACAILGTVANVVTSAAHGDLPNSSTQAGLGFVAARDSWSLVHLGTIVGVLLWVGALVALAGSVDHEPGRSLARLATASAVVGAAVHVVFFSIDGVALKGAADAWAAAPPSERAGPLQTAEAVLLLQRSQFHSAIAFFLGLPFVLFGLAVVFDRTYPAWIGWIGVVAGAGALVTGTTRFVGLDLVPDELLFGGFGLPLGLWMIATGALMWRRAGDTGDHGTGIGTVGPTVANIIGGA